MKGEKRGKKGKGVERDNSKETKVGLLRARV